ncbi:MAG: transporter small permease [Rhizobium sp.]|nr:transporter small permease [Rhizobium sp.]
MEGPSHGWLTGLERAIARINKVSAFIACILVLAIMTLIVIDVVVRYFAAAPLEWVQDSSCFMLVFVFFLALAPALESGSHIEIDLFDPLIPVALRKAQRLLGKAITITFAAILLWFVIKYYRDIYATDEMSFGMIFVSLWKIYWIGIFGSFMFLATALVQFLRFFLTPYDPHAEEAPVASH